MATPTIPITPPVPTDTGIVRDGDIRRFLNSSIQEDVAAAMATIPENHKIASVVFFDLDARSIKAAAMWRMNDEWSLVLVGEATRKQRIKFTGQVALSWSK